MKPALQLKGISKRFGNFVANEDVSLLLEKGEVLALLGENGAGKTTLMNIIFGHYIADTGSVEVLGESLVPGDPNSAIAAGVGMVHQHFTLAENLSVMDNIMLGTESLFSLRTDKDSALKRINTMAQDFGLRVDPFARVADLSIGEKQRIEILKALYGNTRVLIMDEPTAVLTPQESEALFETLKLLVTKGLSVIFISHKLHEILAVSDRILVLRHGRVVDELPTSEANSERLSESMVGKSVTVPKSQPLTPGEPVLRIKGACIPGTKVGNRLVNVDLVVRRHEILGIAGVSGNGQTALANLICGMEKITEGELEIKGQRVATFSPGYFVDSGVGRIPEDRHHEGVVGEMSLWENAISEISKDFTHYGLIQSQKARDFTLNLVREYDIRCSGIEGQARLLSGGNMQKLILARVLSQHPDLIVANQPIRGLDVGAIANVHTQLLAARKNGAAIILITEDLDELLSISDNVAVMSHGSLSDIYNAKKITKTQLGHLMSGGSLEGNDSDLDTSDLGSSNLDTGVKPLCA